MLLKVNPKAKTAERIRGEKLQTFNIAERDLQDILFRTLDRLLYNEELLLIMQSRNWQEEPDLMALDKDGRLYIFELKAWEARSANILQVLRYGQMYGDFKYDELNHFFMKFDDTGRSLREAHSDNFGVNISTDMFNVEQVFIVMTNGLDYKTRQAIQYWRSRNLDVRPWVYRVYQLNSNEMLLEISPFAVRDNPFEDITGQGYYILNTDYRSDPKNHEDMLAQRKAAAYGTPWKHKIERLSKGDIVFLYQSGVGIVAVGKASGILNKSPHGNPPTPENEYAMPLKQFMLLNNPLPAAEVKEITGVDYRFMGTMFALDTESGKKLYAHVLHEKTKR
ncbi:MAG TPA: hypothetical protein PLD25_31605 [Chloroflexota bacterium]|nr:hypothetical protein [Chloroflexota bacterium]HUM69936.1 hypothetical protein [Chloroflexota bacterium]